MARPSKWSEAYRERVGRASVARPAKPPAKIAPVTSVTSDAELEHLTASVARVPTTSPDPVSPSAIEFQSSSNLRTARLDSATGSVDVEFANGSRYRYANVTVEMMAAWRSAPSAGSWLAANLKGKPDQHPAVKLDRK